LYEYFYDRQTRFGSGHKKPLNCHHVKNFNIVWMCKDRQNGVHFLSDFIFVTQQQLTNNN